MLTHRAMIVLTVVALAGCTSETVAPPDTSREATVQPAAAAAGGPGPEYDLVQLTLPSGDAAAGRQAFIDLRCTGCHRVADEPDLPPPVSESTGPDLGPDLAPQSLGILATSIVAPSHAMSIRTSPDTRERVDGVLSPMGDYSGAMTVRQLLDVLAYLDDVRR
jgi:hypothetical protein